MKIQKDNIDEAYRLAEEIERQKRWQRCPGDYFVERLNVPRETFDWVLNPEYAGHKWDGTPNPLMEIIEALARGEWVGVESGTSVGKTFIAACIVLWFLECFDNALVVTTAPKEAQLKLHVWKEIGKLFPKFNLGSLGVLKLKMKPPGDDWIAVGFTAGVAANEESATKAHGFHAEHMLIILEETPGIPMPVIMAFQNTSVSPHNLILALGNPDHQLDSLHIFCALPNVKRIRISQYDHPNIVKGNPSFIPGAASKEGIERMLTRLGGSENPMAKSRIRGISPAQSQDAAIRLEWCYAARDRFNEAVREDGSLVKDHALLVGSPALGIDVAGSESGDKAVKAKGIGKVLLKLEAFPCPNPNKLGHEVFQQMKDEGIDPANVGIDGTGVGSGTINTLKEHEVNVKNLIGAEKQIDEYEDGRLIEGRFGNQRAQWMWKMREDLRNNVIALPYDEELFADLCAPKFFVRGGKIYFESKDNLNQALQGQEDKRTLKQRLGRSPNKGDAAVYWNWVRSDRGGEGWTAGMEVIGAVKADVEAEEDRERVKSKEFRYQPIGRKRKKRSF